MVRLDPVSESEWKLCNEYNKEVTEEFLENSTQLSLETKKAYKSNLMIWFNYVREYLQNKQQPDIKSRDYLKYQNWLINMKHSSADIRNKRAAVSSLNNYIVLFYSDVYPNFKNFIVRGMPIPEKTFVREKNPPTKAEFNNLISVLESQEEWQKVAYLKYTFDTGCRRAESRQLLKEVINYQPIIKTKTIANDKGEQEEVTITYYQSNMTRCKGRSAQGKCRRLKYSQDTMDSIKKWLEVRGEDDCPYVFVSKNQVSCSQISESALNVWCSDQFAKILGRRFYPHCIRSARATSIVVEDGKDIKAVQALLGHESSETSQIYIIKEDDEEEVDDLF